MRNTSAKRTFSQEQVAYMKAKAYFGVCYDACRAHDQVMDAEGARLGLAVPYVILPTGHPMTAKAQGLLDRETEARKLMYEAAFALFDWASESTLSNLGTAQQKADIRKMVSAVKTMAHVEPHFQELVDMSMRLAA